MKNIIITGGSGLIGRSLSSFLTMEGHHVSWLSRKKTNVDYPAYHWNPLTSEIEDSAMIGKDVLIQLAGANIGDGLWTNKQKKEILDSRLKAIHTIYAQLKKKRVHIPHIIQASATGYYGNRKSEVLYEQSTSGNEGFLSEVCKIWETEANCLKEFTDHFTIVRTGLYLSPEGGIWPKIIQTKKFRFLCYFGNGSQFYSWIHYLDYNKAISFIINNKLNGIVNLTAPHPVSNKEFVTIVKSKLDNKILLCGIPVFLLKLIFGEQTELLMDSDYVIPQALMYKGFEFQFESLDDAIEDLLITKRIS